MAKSVKVRSRFSIPGTGFTSAGVAVQNKTIVVAEVDITTYTSGGEPLTAADLGLETIDALLVDVNTIDGSEAATATFFLASYARTTGLLQLSEDAATASAVADSAANVRVVAIGDSATVANLT